MFFRQIAQKNICSYPAFIRRTSVRMIYRPDRTYVFYACKARQTSDYISLILLQLSDFGRYITTTAVVRYVTNLVIYNLVDISLVIYLHAHARVNYHLVIFSPHMYNMYIYRYIYTYMYRLNIHICALMYAYVDISLSVYLKRT